MRIIQEARTPGEGSKVDGHSLDGALDSDDLEADLESEIDVSGDFMAPVWACMSQGITSIKIVWTSFSMY